MHNNELQQVMIINKSKQLAWGVKLKSFILSTMAWFLWGYVLFFGFRYYREIMNSPLIESYFFHEIILAMFEVVAILLTITLIWAKVSMPKKAPKLSAI